MHSPSLTTLSLAVLALAACSSSPSSGPTGPVADAGADDASRRETSTTTPDGATLADDITVPPSIRAQAMGQASITDLAYFSGFSGSHLFGRGGKAPSLPEKPSLITDCRLTVSATDLKLEGGGETVVTPLISSNPSAKTQVVAQADPNHLGGTQLLSFYDVSGAGMNVGIAYGRVISVGGAKPGTAITCGANSASNNTTDRSLDTVTFSMSTLSGFVAHAGSANPYTQKNVMAADLGGAAGKAIFGRGVLVTGGVPRLIDDCKVEVAGGTLTVSGGGFSQSDTFTGAAADSLLLVRTPTDTQFNFQPASGQKARIKVNAFGFVMGASATAADSSTLTCPE